MAPPARPIERETRDDRRLKRDHPGGNRDDDRRITEPGHKSAALGERGEDTDGWCNEQERGNDDQERGGADHKYRGAMGSVGTTGSILRCIRHSNDTAWR